MSEIDHVQSIIYPRWQVRVSIFHFSLGGDTLNSLRPRQNGRLFADDTFKRIVLNENIRISTKNSLKFVPKGLINNMPALVLIMAWRRPGDKPLSEPMLVRSLTNICVTQPQWVNSLSSKDPIWWHKYESSLAQVIACLHITWTSVDSRLLASIPVQFHWKYARIPTKGIIQNQSFSDLYASPRGQLVQYIFDCEMNQICWRRHTLCVYGYCYHLRRGFCLLHQISNTKTLQITI